MLLEAKASIEVAVEKLADHRDKGFIIDLPVLDAGYQECFYEKVLKAKADVAAVLRIF